MSLALSTSVYIDQILARSSSASPSLPQTPMAAAFAVPMTTSSLSQAIRECALAQLLRHAAPEAREAAAHSGLLQAACLALRSEDECAWAPATEILAVFTEDPSLGEAALE